MSIWFHSLNTKDNVSKMYKHATYKKHVHFNNLDFLSMELKFGLYLLPLLLDLLLVLDLLQADNNMYISRKLCFAQRIFIQLVCVCFSHLWLWMHPSKFGIVYTDCFPYYFMLIAFVTNLKKKLFLKQPTVVMLSAIYKIEKMEIWYGLYLLHLLLRDLLLLLDILQEISISIQLTPFLSNICSI